MQRQGQACRTVSQNGTEPNARASTKYIFDRSHVPLYPGFRLLRQINSSGMGVDFDGSVEETTDATQIDTFFDVMVSHDAAVDANLTPCEPVVPAGGHPETWSESRRYPELSVSGRRLSNLGINRRIEGFPSSVLLSGDGQVIYVTSTSHDDRTLWVLSAIDLSPLQSLPLGELYAGLTIDQSSSTLYASGGDSGNIYVFDIEADGTLSKRDDIEVGGFIAFVHFGADTNVSGCLVGMSPSSRFLMWQEMSGKAFS